MRSVTIVGAGLAGHATARALRGRGFAGAITMIGDEPDAPYDRPPLSKEFLAGLIGEADLALAGDDEELDLAWRLGRSAVSLDPLTRTVLLDDGDQVAGDAVVVATGSRARTVASSLPGVHTLRTVADARALRAELVAGARLVIVGAGFVGSEVAATALALGASVTLVEATPAPLVGALGAEGAAAVASLHDRRGARLLCGVGVTDFLGADRVTGVRLTDGTALPADLVLVAIGAEPNVGWLTSTGLELRPGLRCDGVGRTAAPQVYAVGDCSAWWVPGLDEHRRIEHWTDSRDRAKIVAAALMGSPPGPAAMPAPYVWSDQHGVRIQYAGWRRGDEVFTVEAGSAETEDLLGVYWRGGDPVAVLGLNQVREFGRWRRRLVSPSLAAATTPSALVTEGVTA